MLGSYLYGVIQLIQLWKKDIKTNTMMLVGLTINNGINKMDIFKLAIGKTNKR